MLCRWCALHAIPLQLPLLALSSMHVLLLPAAAAAAPAAAAAAVTDLVPLQTKKINTGRSIQFVEISCCRSNQVLCCLRNSTAVIGILARQFNSNIRGSNIRGSNIRGSTIRGSSVRGSSIKGSSSRSSFVLA